MTDVMTGPPPAGAASDLSEDSAVSTFSRSTIAMVITNPSLEDNPIVYVNQAFEKLTGYSAASCVGRNCRFLQGERTESAAVKKLRDGIAHETDVGVTLINYRADGTPFKNALFVTPVYDEDGALSFFIGLQRAADDRDGEHGSIDELISEIQHRVKNHLSMIVGLIRLQARQKGAEGDFEAISRRVESLQLLYEEMTAHRSSRNNNTVALGSYLARVSNAIAHLDGRPGVRVNVDVAPMEVATDRAVHIGLIVSEVLTNALQHAFAGRERGEVSIKSYRVSTDGIRVVITDDGIGIPEGTDWPDARSLGGRIVLSLVDGIDAGLYVTRGQNGTVVTLDVPRDEDGVSGTD